MIAEQQDIDGGMTLEDGIVCIKGGTGPAGTVEDIFVQSPACYLIVFAIKSDDNLGSLIRTAGAFGAREARLSFIR